MLSFGQTKSTSCLRVCTHACARSCACSAAIALLLSGSDTKSTSLYIASRLHSFRLRHFVALAVLLHEKNRCAQGLAVLLQSCTAWLLFIEAPRQASTTRHCSFFTPCVFFSFFQLLLLPVISASVASIRCRPSCAVPWRLTCRAWMRCSRPSVRRTSVC